MVNRKQSLEERWQTVVETSRFLNSQLELDVLLELVLDKSIAVIQAEAGTLWLVEEDGFLVPKIVRGPRAEILKEMRLKPGEGLAGQVVAKNEPRLVEDVRKNSGWAKRFDEATGFKTFSLLCIPLRARKEVIGCLQLINKKERKHFSADDLEIALAFAGQAAIALENSRLYTWQVMLLNSLIRALVSALDARDPYTRGHSERVSQYSLLIGKELDLTPEELKTLERVALLHDIGKIGIWDEILLQQGPLDPEKQKIMKAHSEIGARILADVKPRHLAGKIHEGALYHQEKYDGSGYPRGIKGDDIPLVARIIAVADAFDAITIDRPYRKGASFTRALAEIERCAGTHFDPQIAKALTQAIKREYQIEENP